MISLQNIEKVYRTNTIETLALNSINLNIKKGEFLSVMGPRAVAKVLCSISWDCWMLHPKGISKLMTRN